MDYTQITDSELDVIYEDSLRVIGSHVPHVFEKLRRTMRVSVFHCNDMEAMKIEYKHLDKLQMELEKYNND
ncbi:hypothetical protein [Enterovibrio baiacu]|uniref:hypothetical protein n=1 Tax=Enterovibrio baiacu TaxID=2491023 RepID=UPI0010130983|nr:hypothetical protein [Enterovibrio baiacu]MBE1275100.1 hypothetical protein [Enterovibrio baiacu]